MRWKNEVALCRMNKRRKNGGNKPKNSLAAFSYEKK